MNPSDNLPDVGVSSMAGQGGETFRLRSYQAEMVEESMTSNIICVMDTGSGKTHIAIDRTRAELETCQLDKRVWFLAPTVTLCEQQYEVFKSNLPGYGIQLLSGKDNLDHWTEQAVWDAVLHNVRIVLSTHQVLLDALTHGFVKMNELALLIFDEAHHCTLNHPAHRIMSDFYMPRAGNTGDLPKVLGLSASPVVKAKATSEDLQQIERNLCATARTPKLHRSELMRYVHRPQLIRVDYPAESAKDPPSNVLASLRHAFESYDLKQDPYVLELLQQQRQGFDISKKLQKVCVNGKTYCRDQLKLLVEKAEAMLEELGSSPMEWYVRQCIAQFEKMVRTSDSQLFDSSGSERKHLLNILMRLPSMEDELCVCPFRSLERFSQKMSILIDLLVSEAKDDPNFTCLVFIEQRVWVACIAEILSLHPRTKALLRVGTFVGTSQSSKRKANVATFAEPRNQQTTLDDFRAGRLNLILATSVLEEGIDVSSCHLVICFERPKNLKSFVQRRGRARKQDSKYIIFVPEMGGGRPPEFWQSLEEEMKAAYLDDLRKVQLAEDSELQDEDGKRFFEVPSTRALLTLDNASQHLHHFCSLLGSGPYIDTRPQFEFTETQFGLITARVTLPILVDPAVRSVNGSETWATERKAKQDAAFEAYKSLYLAGLVNDNLLPARQEAAQELTDSQIPDNTPSLVQVSSTLDPWPPIARQQQKTPHVYHRTLLTLQTADKTPKHMLLLMPTILPNVPEIVIYWNQSSLFRIDCSSLPGMALEHDQIVVLKSITHRILYSVHGGRMEAGRQDFPWLIVPCDTSGHLMSSMCSSDWGQGSCPATALLAQGRHDLSKWGLITRKGEYQKYMPKAIKLSKSESPASASASTSTSTTKALLQVVRLPKRRDFLHPVTSASKGSDAYTKIEEIEASECIVDELPVSYSVFALLFPSFLHRVDVSFVAETLRTTLLRPVAFGSIHLPLIIRALTSSATGDDANYQRLEFLGDCILKFITTVHLMACNLSWPESYLTAKKGKVVSNGFLARATLAAGLDKFVITKRFTGAKWAPRYAGDLLAGKEPAVKVERSSKLIADVVESLIGASYITGGFEKALLCVRTLLPLESWTAIPTANAILHEAAPTEATFTDFSILETLVGHNFSKKTLLLEALTHASFTGPHVHCSYERLEFLGDAVLDYIISKRLYTHVPSLSHQKMHAIRTATVNASFLAFRMFETTVPQVTTNKTTMQPELQHRALWQFLRSGNSSLNTNRDTALRQHESVRKQIIAGLNSGTRFPWHLLALNDAPKFLSDIVESIIGAIYIDSQGDILSCEVTVRRFGILDCLERILSDEVDCLHPKERLGHLAVEKDVQYVRVKESYQGMDTSDDKMYRCQVKVGGEDVGGVVEGLKRLNAETIAAWRAVEILESRREAVMEGSTDEDEFFDVEDGGGVMLEDR